MTAAVPLPAGYVFADRDDQPGGHRELLDQLSAMLDRFSRRRLAWAGVRPGLRCLEVGAGNGSIACWLADQVGVYRGRAAGGGEVLATDLDISHIPSHPGVTVLRHDITCDPLPEGGFDLIHVRLLLAHLPERTAILLALADALNPGGVLVVEEFEASWDRCVMDTPDEDGSRLFAQYHEALVAVMQAGGTDPSWGRRVHQVMRRSGLVNVETEFWATSWHGGQAGCLLPYVVAEHRRDRLVAAGMSDADIDAFRALLLDPRLVVRGNMALSTTGRKPEAR